MGAENSNESFYVLAPLNNFSYGDSKPTQYFWIDKNVQKQQNKIYLSRFQKNFIVKPLSNLEGLQNDLEMETGQCRLQVICSASFPDDLYEYVQKTNSIERGMLFCASRVRAENLLMNYPKFKKACFGFKNVIEEVQTIKKEDHHHLYVFQVSEMAELRAATVHWHALTDISLVLTPSMRYIFFQYCRNVLQGLEAEDAKELEQSDITEASKLVNYAMGNHFLLKEINLLLRSTKNPTKLAYLRWPVYNLYHFIKERYKSFFIGSLILEGIITLNSIERQKLKQGAIINIVQFILAFPKSPQINPSEGEVLIKIHVGNSHDVCNGYYATADGAIFNIGNFYEVRYFNPQNNKLGVTLLATTKKQAFQLEDPLSGIALFQLKMDRMTILKQGQWYSLFLAGLHQEADQYLRKIAFFRSKRSDLYLDDEFDWTIARQKAKLIYENKKLDGIKSLLKDTLPEAQKIQIFMALAENSILNSQDIEFFQYWDQIKSLLQKINNKCGRVESQKIDILRAASDLIKKKLVPCLNQLQRLEKQYLKQGLQIQLSSMYLLLLVLKARCLRELQRFESERKVLDIITWILGSTVGESWMLSEIKGLKVKNYQKSHEGSEREWGLQIQLKTTEIPIISLLQKNKPLKLELQDFDFSYFS